MKKIIINFKEKEIQTALFDGEKLIELVVDEQEQYSCVGNIYVGIVKNILPSKFVFVDIGHEKNAFLYLEDNRECYLIENGEVKIKNGQHLLVQVMKDAVGDKGAGVTTQISFSSRNMVVFVVENNPWIHEIGVSKKIEDKWERKRLKEMAQEISQKGFGLIMRTESAGCEKEELIVELDTLLKKTRKVIEQGTYAKPPAVIYKEEHILAATLREFAKDGAEEVFLSSEKDFALVQNLVRDIWGEHGKVTLVKDTPDIFTKFALDKQLTKAFGRRVWLKSGGFIVVEQTEACVVIDVNSGKYSGRIGEQDSALTINREAAKEIAYQMRLRNLSGMIIVDFIDMKTEREKEELITILAAEVKKDRVPVTVVGMTQLGLMQLTRKKTRRPVKPADLGRCPYCGMEYQDHKEEQDREEQNKEDQNKEEQNNNRH